MKYLLSLFILIGLASCGEEVVTQNTVNDGFTTSALQSFSVSTCAQRTFARPPVDILYVVDNTGSTIADSFQSLKSQLENTINTISSDFDYHIYFVPLNASPGENATTYPLLANNPDSIPNLSQVNLVQPSNLEFFAQASGNNVEHGMTRAYNIIQLNRDNGIFRENANTIIVMISNGDDTESNRNVGGNVIPDQTVLSQQIEEFKSLTKKYADANSLSNPLNAQMVRFFSLTAKSTCNGWKVGNNYQQLSRELYDYQALTDNNIGKDTVDLCSQNYSTLFSPINNSIQAVIIGHKYDHWKISSASESQIQANDIEVTKLKLDGSRVSVPEGSVNGFEYLGYQTNIDTRYEPTSGEPVSGLVVKLNGSARVEYPDCIIAKTRTPTEYFGYITVPREPDLETTEIEINGSLVPPSAQNGWTYVGFRDTINIKVPGPDNVSVTPPVNKSGYTFQLNGNAIYTNGDTINVFYKPKAQ